MWLVTGTVSNTPSSQSSPSPRHCLQHQHSGGWAETALQGMLLTLDTVWLITPVSLPLVYHTHTHTHTPAVHCKCCNCCVIQSLTHWHLSGYDGSLIWWYLIYSASSCSCSSRNHQVDITANVKHRKPVALWQHYTSIPIHYEKHSTITGKS